MDESSRIAALELENERLRRQVHALSGVTASSVEERLGKLMGDRVVLANLPDFISILERDTRVVYLNRTIPGRTVDEMIGTLSTDHLVGVHRTRFIEEFEAAWTYAELREFEFATVSDYHFISRFVPIVDTGKTAFVLVTTTDVTERRRTEIALRDSEARLRQVQKMEAVGRLTAGIAHNFNNALGIILPSVDLARISSTHRMAERLDAIEHAAKRASEMVRDLMLFARGSGQTRGRPEDVVALLQRTLGIASSTLGPTIALALDAEPDLPAVVLDAGQLEQVLLNVLLNARDALTEAATDDPHIAIRVARTSTESLTIRITDNGPGMDEATRSQVFEPFFTTKPGNRGTGLGLASAYAIVIDHGGRIRCESARGEGTTIVIELPVTAEPASEGGVPSPPAPMLGSESILVVDDEPGFRDVVRTILEHAGFRVTEAEDGLAGLAKLDEPGCHFDLILVDGAMPRLGGAEFVATLARRTSRPRVVFLSGNLHTSIDGVDAILEKPVSMQLLLETVRSILDRA